MGATSTTKLRKGTSKAVATRRESSAPTSCPTRSMGCSILSRASASHSAYASLVAVNPAGRGVPNPGRARATEPRPRILLSEFQIRLVSGNPWTKTAATIRCYESLGTARPQPRGCCRAPWWSRTADLLFTVEERFLDWTRRHHREQCPRLRLWNDTSSGSTRGVRGCLPAIGSHLPSKALGATKRPRRLAVTRRQLPITHNEGVPGSSAGVG
jgi:hypothetical protein